MLRIIEIGPKKGTTERAEGKRQYVEVFGSSVDKNAEESTSQITTD